VNKYIAFVFLLLFGNNNLGAQVNIEFDSTLFKEIVGYSAEEFDNWLIPKLKGRPVGGKPRFESVLVLERLRSDRFTTNNAVISMVNSIIETDKEFLRKTYYALKDRKYFHSVNYIDTLLTTIYERPYLETQLIKKRVELNKNNLGIGYSYPIDQCKKAISLSDSLRMEAIISKNFISYKLARHYFENNEFELAEHFYGEVLQYPYFKEKDNKVKKELYIIYIEAGRDMLLLRKDSLPLLERTFFVNPAEPVLKPIRDRLIADLKKKK